jgi:hypothetical protein
MELLVLFIVLIVLMMILFRRSALMSHELATPPSPRGDLLWSKLESSRINFRRPYPKIDLNLKIASALLMGFAVALVLVGLEVYFSHSLILQEDTATSSMFGISPASAAGKPGDDFVKLPLWCDPPTGLCAQNRPRIVLPHLLKPISPIQSPFNASQW